MVVQSPNVVIVEKLEEVRQEIKEIDAIIENYKEKRLQLQNVENEYVSLIQIINEKLGNV